LYATGAKTNVLFKKHIIYPSQIPKHIIMKLLAALTFALSALGLASATKCCADKSVRILLDDMSLTLYPD
jgi:hypothetical protein